MITRTSAMSAPFATGDLPAPLATALPDDLKTRLAQWPEARRDAFIRAVQAQDARQNADLDAAFERSLAHIPALLRGAVRKLLGI